MYDTPMQCVALKKSGITSFKQLDGKTVGVGPKRRHARHLSAAVLRQHSVIKATIRNGQGADMGSQLGDGILDAFCFGAGLPIPIFSQLDAEKEVGLLHLDRCRAGRKMRARRCRNSPRR